MTKIKVNETIYDIEIIGNKVTVDGKEIEVKVNEDKIIIKGKTFNIDFTEEGDPSIMIINGMVYVVSKGNLGYLSVNEIKAPMHGKIVNILVNEGDQVNNGQVLIVLEAMKMENQIRSPRKGTIRNIKIVNDQSVKIGDTLLTFE
ncbi:MAG TPA: acetyl-CoA carboxylase biotin carboxyl carrier protein subunit [Nitrososphaeraceae archaeon]|jgi:biotin carboxyl carrier protein|nr:acetyl-CoA carboxylase biotin carboxyl carrier protein subunit [Nitrososphaeraceae archaeon]